MYFEEKTIGEIHYLVRYPNGFDNKKKYPVILFLHGAGGRGTDLEIVKSSPYFSITETYADFPFITVAPQCSAGTWFDLFETLKVLVCRIAGEQYTDRERFYVMGASMGGYATWQIAMSMPEYFAAIVPICGGGMYWYAGQLKNVAVWAFHGAKDSTVLVDESQKMVDAANRAGGNARLTVYPENAHDSWSDTYKNSKVFQWFLQHRNENAKAISDFFRDSKIYG